MIKHFFTFIAFILSFSNCFSTEIHLKVIHKYGDGFNIEGGDLAKLNQQPGQEWGNLCMVLDRPFCDQKTWTELTKENTYPLKESSLLDYDESKVNLAILLIIDHFKKQGAQKRLHLQIHRNSSGIKFMDYFCPILKVLYADDYKTERSEEDGFPIFHFTNGFTLALRNGVTPKAYPHFTTLISLSLMGGLNENYPSGTMTLPNKFTPFDIKNNVIDLTKSYNVNNILVTELEAILDVDQSHFFPIIDQFKSPNLQKKFRAVQLTRNHFKSNVTLLQIDDMYNPEGENFNDPVRVT